MARFYGRSEHSLDAKGRLILPAKFREPFEPGGFLTQHQENDGCLALWTREDFEKVEAEMLIRSAGDGRDRNHARVWAAAVEPVEPDRQGRIGIPSYLRQHAGLAEGPVLVTGVIDHVELWDLEAWQRRVELEQSGAQPGTQPGTQPDGRPSERQESS